MIIIKNVTEAKKDFSKFKKKINEFYTGLVVFIDNEGVTIKGCNKNNEDISIYFQYEEGVQYDYLYKYTLEANAIENIFDIIFDKGGFMIEAYKNAYSDSVKITTDYGECHISEVILRSRKKIWKYKTLCSGGIECIEKL